MGRCRLIRRRHRLGRLFEEAAFGVPVGSQKISMSLHFP